jgi:hypothetical protein
MLHSNDFDRVTKIKNLLYQTFQDKGDTESAQRMLEKANFLEDFEPSSSEYDPDEDFGLDENEYDSES